MDQERFNRVAATAFAVVAALHATRLVRGWDAVVAGKAAPLWVSGVGAVVAGLLSGWALSLSRRPRGVPAIGSRATGRHLVSR
ncbi:MAG: hypothetical protein HY553_21015 [Elusimicrobia bacterium]|nr:hypothetical protein [Elusimicrobiota bacterium]